MRVQPSYELRRSHGRPRSETGHRAPSCVADHHLHRLHNFCGMPRPGHPDVSVISGTEGNHPVPMFHRSFERIPTYLQISFQSDRTTIHKNLCVCLLIAEILFVCGIGQTNQRIVCGIVAGLLHFFFLCAFAWMFLEGSYRTQFMEQSLVGCYSRTSDA